MESDNSLGMCLVCIFVCVITDCLGCKTCVCNELYTSYSTYNLLGEVHTSIIHCVFEYRIAGIF